jgi:type II restriction enzyme
VKPLPDIQQAQDILKNLGLPTAQQNEISALTLLALVGLGPDDKWSDATRSRRSVSKDIMAFIAEQFGKTYAPNTRETVRRQVLHQFMQARVAEYNPFEPDLPTNSPRAHYAISDAALIVIKTYETKAWAGAVAQFIAAHGSLANTYAKHRSTGTLVPITLPDGSKIELSPGKHNDVQKAIIEQFAPRFAPDAKLLYIGDTAKKNVIMDAVTLATLGLGADDHDKLPDVVLFDQKKKWLFLIESVTSHGPMSPKRVFEIEERLRNDQVGPIYVSAFPDMAEFRKHMRDIAWETEVWIVEIPDHMIHFNSDRFLGPRR